MKIQFKKQEYQTRAVEAVLACFEGQARVEGTRYGIDPGISKAAQQDLRSPEEFVGFKNAELTISQDQLLENIQKVQRSQNLPISRNLYDFKTFGRRGEAKPVDKKYRQDALEATPIHLDIEMETGTGKTYCYIKTIFEMNKRFGWSKFIIVVPSIAIREGIAKSFEITAEHFHKDYGQKVQPFVYNSDQLNEIQAFSTSSKIQVMIINSQAFHSPPKKTASESYRSQARFKIYRESDDFQSRRPIDVIAANRPILILDEPQKLEGTQTMGALKYFNPLMILRYSATHRTRHHLIHRLDAVDAFNQKLVKRIAVRGVQAKGISGASPYLYLEGIDISKKREPVARIELEIRYESGAISRKIRRVKRGDDLYIVSKELDQYREGYTITEVDARTNTVEFINGLILQAGQASHDLSEEQIRHIQIRETIRAHLEKERQLFDEGIKVLSLFFIDEVAKYRDYDAEDEKGVYARIFEEEYEKLREELILSELRMNSPEYYRYIEEVDAQSVHNGYFSIDRQGRLVNTSERNNQTAREQQESSFNLIMRDKERLLSFDEPTRFIFSHSALREGWDNPNIFTICTLKHSDNTISRRQEVGRGLRISVNQEGARMDDPARVHDINILTVVASESYEEFVTNLQREISETLTTRPRQVTEEYLEGKVLVSEDGEETITPQMATQIYYYLITNKYIDYNKEITEAYHEARLAEELAPLPEEIQQYAQAVYDVIDSVFSEGQLPKIDDSRKRRTNLLNDNFSKEEFKRLWNRINHRAIYQVDFNTDELIENCVHALNNRLQVSKPEYRLEVGFQKEQTSAESLRSGASFEKKLSKSEEGAPFISSQVPYDLIGKLAESAELTRQTIAKILSQMSPQKFKLFEVNPEQFLSRTAQLIKEQKATMVIEHLTYDMTDQRFDKTIFTNNQLDQDFSRAVTGLKKHIYDFVITDSQGETNFTKDLEVNDEVLVYAKLPRGFYIPTPLGNYNPDWAISFKEGSVKHIYFVAETKGTLKQMELRGVEEAKIESAKKFFKTLNERIDSDEVKYGVALDYDSLLQLVRGENTAANS